MKQECGQPVTRHVVIDCAKSLITGSTLVTTIVCFHQSNSKNSTREFGITWYRSFMRRNRDQLEIRGGERQHKIRTDWTAHEKFVTMYDLAYTAMVDEKVATTL